MPILQLQRRLSEVGRIRLGQQIETKSGKKRPAALTTFRLTSADRSRIEEAAKLYGGKVTEWDAPSGIKSWEVITEAEKLPVVVPPSAMAFSQYYELWSAGGCQRRCDGVTETLSEQPCLCDPDERQCEIHTRLSVMLRDLSGLGVWRVDTQGYYAAVELQGSVEVISLAAGRGQMLPAALRLDKRQIKRSGEGLKQFVVPVLDVEVSASQLLMGTVQITGRSPVPVPLEEPAQRSLTPVPDGGPTPSIADQVTASENQPSRRRASTQAIPSPGLAPRTAAQAQATRPTQKYTSRVTDNFEPPARDESQDQSQGPRMCTNPQLQKLGILLNKQGFDGTKEGKAARMDFCTAALKQLFPDSPHSDRKMTSSKELTFDEAHALIDMLETDERKDQELEEKRLRDNAIQDMAEGSTPISAPEQSAPEPEQSMEEAAEQARRRRAGNVQDGEEPAPQEQDQATDTEGPKDEDPEADSPHGPGCEPGCTLTDEQHPPYVPPAEEGTPGEGVKEPETENSSGTEESAQDADAQMTLG